jgi:hypothetical protein
MRQHLIRRVAATALLAAILAAPAADPSMGEDIGVTAATNPVATGEPPGQGVRELRIGLNVVRNERIRTTAVGSTQVIFVDRTSLTIGPNSDITIDQYVYNPGGGGSLAVRIGRGVLRFIGGEISHSDQIRITTPTATLGIRGGMAIVDASHKKTHVVNLYGATTVTTPFNSVTLSSAGTYVETGGGRVSDVIAVPPALLARFQALLASKRDQTGGAGRGLITSQTLRQIVTSSGPLSNRSSNLSEEQLQFMVSIRPQLESITRATQNNPCTDFDHDCDRDRRHHHRHDRDHDHDHDRDYDRVHHHEEHYGREAWGHLPHSGPPPGWHPGGDFGRFGPHAHTMPNHAGPLPMLSGGPHHH